MRKFATVVSSGGKEMVTQLHLERPYTAADLEAIEDDRNRYEIIGGELLVSPAPAEPHQRASSRLLRFISNHVEGQDLGLVYSAPFAVHLSEYDVPEPDIVVVLKENGARLKHDGVDGPPDLVVEIVSPSSSRIDRVRKAALYATFGVSEYWIADPDDGTILAQALVGQHYEPIGSEDGHVRLKAIAGLVIDPVAVFAVPDWMPAGS